MALDRRSKTAFALRNLDTRLAVRFKPRDGELDVVLILLLLPFVGEHLSLSPCKLLPLEFSLSIDIVWRLLANNCLFALLLFPGLVLFILLVVVRISLTIGEVVCDVDSLVALVLPLLLFEMPPPFWRLVPFGRTVAAAEFAATEFVVVVVVVVVVIVGRCMTPNVMICWNYDWISCPAFVVWFSNIGNDAKILS